MDVIDIVKQNNSQILRLVVQLPVPKREGEFALHLAASQGLTECVRLLVNEGHVDPNASNSSGCTALMAAAQNGHEEVIQALLDTRQCRVNAVSVSGATALHGAAQYGHLECAKLLVAAGAALNAQDTGGSTPLHAAAKNCRFNPDVMEYLVELPGCRLNAQCSDGRTPLHFVVKQADLITWSGILLAAGADPDVRDTEGNTPFMYAATEGFDELMKCLLAFHCNPNIGNIFGKTPLHFLAQKNHHGVINFMAKLKSPFDPVDKEGNTPLYYAVNHNRVEAVKALLRGNCKLDPPKGSSAKKPLEVALEKQLWGIGKLLVLAGCEVAPLYPWLRRVEAEEAGRQRERLTLFEEQLEEEARDAELEEARRWFSEWLHSPHSLKQLCRIEVRGYLGMGLLLKGGELPLPPAMRDYITLKEVHDLNVPSYRI